MRQGFKGFTPIPLEGQVRKGWSATEDDRAHDLHVIDVAIW